MYYYIYKYTNYALLDNEERHRRIVIEFINNNQGCTAEQLVDGVHKDLSRVPVYNTLKDLLKKGIVQDRKANRRDHRFYVDANNPLVLIPKQLGEIETTFRKLLDKSKPHWQDISKQRLNALKELNVDLLFELYGGPKSLVYFVPAMILQIITDSITIHASTIWITKIADRDTLNKLFTIVFKKLASLNIDYVDYLKSIHHSHPEVVKFDNAVINRVHLPLQLMYVSRKIYKAIGMEKETEEMLDLLWKFSEDIRIFLFPEIKIYKYKISSWRNLLDIYEKNPDQNAQNHYLVQKQ